MKYETYFMLQTSHSKGLTPRCIRLCFLRDVGLVKECPHVSHTYG